MEKIYAILKNSIKETFQLLWPFKWYILVYLLWGTSSLYEYFNPPAANDPILKYEYRLGSWNYINQEVYIQSMKLFFIEDVLVFLLATSNIRNHPLLAKCIFLYPLIALILGAIIGIME